MAWRIEAKASDEIGCNVSLDWVISEVSRLWQGWPLSAGAAIVCLALPPRAGIGRRKEGNAMKSWRVAGINFDHLHMGDLLREVHEHPNAEIAGICDARAGADGGGAEGLRHSRRPRLHRRRQVHPDDQAGPDHPLPGDRRACRLRRTGRALRHRHPGRKTLRGDARRRRPDDCRRGQGRHPHGDQLAARLVSESTSPPSGWSTRAPSARLDRGALLRRQSRPALSTSPTRSR